MLRVNCLSFLSHWQMSADDRGSESSTTRVRIKSRGGVLWHVKIPFLYAYSCVQPRQNVVVCPCSCGPLLCARIVSAKAGYRLDVTTPVLNGRLDCNDPLLYLCYKETLWLGMHRQSETRAGNHRRHTCRYNRQGRKANVGAGTATATEPTREHKQYATQGPTTYLCT